MTLQQAVEEANRCLLCAEPPCNTDCAAGTEPAKFIRQLKFGNIKGAIRTIRRNNLLGGSCAFVCPTCRLCEKGCSRSGLDVPIRIAEIQAFLIDYERNLGMETLVAPKPGDKKIAVIGAGPAGLCAAGYLALAGYQVTVFEKEDQPGGTLRYGIPVFRLPREILDFECDIIRRLGVKFKYHQKITGEQALDKLLEKGFDAIYVATGWDQPYALGLKGEDADGVFLWDKFLRLMNDQQQRRILARKMSQKNVVVVGGGSVAMDCAVWAKYAGARRVYTIFLEGLEEMPADKEEKELAFAEKVIFKPNARITEIIVRGGKVRGVKGVEIRWREPGKFVPENAEDIPGTEFSLVCDFVIEAIGTGLSTDALKLFSGLKRQGKCLVVNEKTFRTSKPRIYAGGDLAHTGGTVAMAVKDGKTVAQAIIKEVPLTKPATMPGYTSKPSLAVTFCGVKFLNPFLLSSSPVANTAEMVARAFEAGWGGAVYKTMGLEKKFKIMDPSPRLNALHYQEKRFVGLQNIEQISERPFEQNLKDIRWLTRNFPDRPIIASIMGYSVKDWVELAQGAEAAGAAMLELNFSCPQMARADAGHTVGQRYDLLEEYTRATVEAVKIPVMPKMTPNITDMVPVALACKRGGAAAISAINTLRAITDVDLERFVPKPNINGKSSISGYSGAAVKPIALRFIAEMAKSRELGLPLSAIGGIETWRDAVMFLLLGATTVQVTTAVMHYGYRIIEDMIEGTEDYLTEHGFKSIEEIIGKALPNLTEPDKLNLKIQVVSRVNEEKCIGCGACYIACRDGANQAMEFDLQSRKARTNEDRCVGCLLCQHVCPVWDCISYKHRRKYVTGGMHEDALKFIEK